MGTPANDIINGTPNAELIYGNQGDDTINGGGGQDSIFGGQGDDLISGTGFVYGNLGNDRINFGGTAFGGAGEDMIQGIGIAYGNLGDDVIGINGNGFGGQGNDTVIGAGDSRNTIYGNMGNDVLIAGAMGDTLFGGQGDDMLFGSSGADLLFGNLGQDTLRGGDGQDTAVLRGGTDYSFSRSGEFLVATAADGGSTTFIAGDVEMISANGATLNAASLAPAPVSNPPAPTPRDTILRSVDDTVNAKGLDAKGDQLFGTANGGQHVSSLTDATAQFESYLRPHERGQAGASPIRIDTDGVAVYGLPSGMQTQTRTAASLDFGLITGLGGGAGTVDQLTASILIDGDLSSGTRYTEFVKQARTGGTDAPYRAANGASFGGDEGGNGRQGPQVSENSLNFGFAGVRALIDGDTVAPGIQQYNGEAGLLDVVFRTIGADGFAADNHIRLQIGNGGGADPLAPAA